VKVENVARNTPPFVERKKNKVENLEIGEILVGYCYGFASGKILYCLMIEKKNILILMQIFCEQRYDD